MSAVSRRFYRYMVVGGAALLSAAAITAACIQSKPDPSSIAFHPYDEGEAVQLSYIYTPVEDVQGVQEVDRLVEDDRARVDLRDREHVDEAVNQARLMPGITGLRDALSRMFQRSPEQAATEDSDTRHSGRISDARLEQSYSSLRTHIVGVLEQEDAFGLEDILSDPSNDVANWTEDGATTLLKWGSDGEWSYLYALQIDMHDKVDFLHIYFCSERRNDMLDQCVTVVSFTEVDGGPFMLVPYSEPVPLGDVDPRIFSQRGAYAEPYDFLSYIHERMDLLRE